MFSLTTLANEIRKLAAEYPNNVYGVKDTDGDISRDTCCYASGLNSSCPEFGCIVGVALRHCGVPLSVLEAVDDDPTFNPTAKSLLPELIKTGHVSPLTETDKSLVGWICAVQQKQDQCFQWQEAVDAADGKDPIHA